MTIEKQSGQNGIDKEPLKSYVRKTLFILAALAIGPTVAISTFAAVDFASIQRVNLSNKLQKLANNLSKRNKHT